MDHPACWHDRECLAPLLEAWRRDTEGRQLFRVAAGSDWLRLYFEGDDRLGLLMTALPGAVVAAPLRGPLPAALHTALAPVRGNPLVNLLRNGRLQGVALLADDLALALRIETSAGPRFVRHQLFGRRGGLVVLDHDGRMLWTAHPSPYPCLVDSSAPLAKPAPAATDADLDLRLEQWSHDALQRVARQQETALADRLNRVITRRRDAAARLVANLQTDLQRADGGETRRREAETLAAFLHTVTRGQKQAVLTDPADGTERTIDLDPAIPPHANLERLFKAARKAERGRDIIASRLEAARRDLAENSNMADRLEPLIAGPAADRPLDSLTDTDARLAALQTFRADHDLLALALGAPRSASPDAPARPFRRYTIDGRWEVWIGRSRQENDDLTHRASHPRDLWLHAQGVSGSHVIVRTNGRPDTVPRSVLEKAAALAALHSKARHSAYVPVIWTERRYVRKPRKAPPGTAVCLRDQNLFVEPGIAEGVEAD